VSARLAKAKAKAALLGSLAAQRLFRFTERLDMAQLVGLEASDEVWQRIFERGGWPSVLELSLGNHASAAAQRVGPVGTLLGACPRLRHLALDRTEVDWSACAGRGSSLVRLSLRTSAAERYRGVPSWLRAHASQLGELSVQTEHDRTGLRREEIDGLLAGLNSAQLQRLELGVLRIEEALDALSVSPVLAQLRHVELFGLMGGLEALQPRLPSFAHLRRLRLRHDSRPLAQLQPLMDRFPFLSLSAFLPGGQAWRDPRGD
jgi:hypothetical protein